MTTRCFCCLKPIDVGRSSLLPNDPTPLFCYLNDGTVRGYESEPDVHILCCTGGVEFERHGTDHYDTCPNYGRPVPDDQFYKQLDDMYYRHTILHPKIIEDCVHDLHVWLKEPT